VSLRYYARQCRKWDEIVPGVLIGRKLNHREAQAAICAGVTAVLDLTAEFSEAAPFLKIAYLNVPVLDLTAPTQGQLKRMADFVSAHAAAGKVYVHCKIGYSRSAAAVGAYLLQSGKAGNVTDALAQLRRARPAIVIREEIVSALTLFSAAPVSTEPTMPVSEIAPLQIAVLQHSGTLTSLKL
jgi:hypothetical protein